MAIGVDQKILGNAHEPALRMLQLRAGGKCNQEAHKDFVTKIPGGLAISQVFREETYNILMIAAI